VTCPTGRRSREEAELRAPVDHLRADPGPGREHGVGVLGVPFGPQQRGIAARPAYDELPSPGGDLRVESGQPTRELPPQSSNAATTASSMVCFGPVNHFRAEANHQIVTKAIVPKVRIGA